MKKISWNSIISIAVAIAFACLAIPKAEGAMTRGIYVNGEVHYFNVGADSKNKTISHQSGKADSNFLLTLGTAAPLNVDSCTPDPGGVAMNGAVFDNKIFFAYTGNKGCTSTKPNTGDTHIYVIYWDLTTQSWGEDLNLKNLPPKDLGSVHHRDMSTTDGYLALYDMAGAAIVVFANKLYVFSDSATYTSGDGINWSAYPALAVGGTDMQPLDAITFYPPDADPKMMIIYGQYTNPNGAYSAYNSVYAATWNGQFDNASVLNGQIVITSRNVYGYQYNIANCLALLAGTASPPASTGLSAGAKTPALQLFIGESKYSTDLSTIAYGLYRLEYSYNTTGGNWKTDPEFFTHSNLRYVYPWFTKECTTTNNITRQHLVISTNNKSPAVFPITSDAMVPQNAGIQPSCQNGQGGDTTDTSTGDNATDDNATRAARIRSKYWTLVGVVMGSPPFGVNELDQHSPTEIPKLSNVTYTVSESTGKANSQETESSVMIAAGITIMAGIKDILGFKGEFDDSFKHAWESEHEHSTKSTLSYGFNLGTNNAAEESENIDKLGMMGWGIFNMPTIITQDYALYAYDYDVTTNSGTPIDRHIITTQAKQDSYSTRAFAFELANPGGPNDDVPGLMTGIQPLTKSTDFTGWKKQWESDGTAKHDPLYITKLGSAGIGEPRINQLGFGTGSSGSVTFSNEEDNVTTKGHTTDATLNLGMEFSLGTEITGIKADIKVGYDSHYSTAETNTTVVGKNIEADLGMVTCYDSGCIKTLTIQPYLLQAQQPDAPWIPDGYKGHLPWAIHWYVFQATPYGGTVSGTSPQADQVVGTIVGPSSGDEIEAASGCRESSYFLKGGKMAWQDQEGALTTIPMTADEFDPDAGATITLNGYSRSTTQAVGTWTRRGATWTFTTAKDDARGTVVLNLHFGNQTWDIGLFKSDLSPYLKAADARMHVSLNVNGKYEFYFTCDHKVKSHWNHTVEATAPDTYELTGYSGWFNTATGRGAAVLEGTLPAGLKCFGDMSFWVNGHQINAPLISLKNYENALANGGVLFYRSDGFNLFVNFGKKKWRASFTNMAFHQLLAPRAGVAQLTVKVGGGSVYSKKFEIKNYTSKLSY